MHKIIVPVDFSDISAYGTTLAVKLASYLHAEIHFLHVVNLPSHILLTPQGELFEDGDFDVSIPKQQKAAACVKMDSWAQRYFPKATTCVCYGHVTEDVIRYARANKASLIVMGTHAVSGLKEVLTNSHGEYIAMHSDVPVMTIKSDQPDMPVQRILLAGSFRKDDIPHCDMAIALQRAFDASLYLLRVNTPNDFLPEEETYQHMESFVQQHRLSNVKLAVCNDQDVEEGILQYVAKNNIDMIAIGSKQRTGLNKLINGCVSADLVNHANKPILTFKLKD